MKKKLSILIAICLLVFILTGMFVACDKNPDVDNKRQTAINDVKGAFIDGVNEDWTATLEDSQIAKLDNAGDYVVAVGWTEFVLDLLDKSTIQTSKIQSLATALSSKDGKDLLSNFEDNGQKLLSLLKTIGFTANEINNLIIDIVKGIVNDATGKIDDILTNLNGVKNVATQNAKALANINDNIASLSFAKSKIVLATEEKEVICAAIDDAKDVVGQLVAFAYDMSMSDIVEDIFDTLTSENGALADITNTEITTFVNTLLQNVRALKTALTTDAIAKLNRALDLVIKKFDTVSMSSALYTQIVSYAKYVYMVIDVLPTICDVVIAGGDIAADVDFLNAIKTYEQTKDSLTTYTSQLNLAILCARALDSVMQGLSAQSFAAVLDRILEGGIDEYQKATPIMLVDTVLNFTVFYGMGEDDVFELIHPDIMSVELLSKCTSVATFNSSYGLFVEGISKYNSGQIDVYALITLARNCGFEEFGANNPYDAKTLTEAWYNYYKVTGLRLVNDFVANNIATVVDDLKAFVDDYYAQNSTSRDATLQLANMPLFEDNADAEVVESCNALIYSSPILTLLTLMFGVL